jgi:hypothetical protein
MFDPMATPSYWKTKRGQANGLSLVCITEESELRQIQACCVAKDLSHLGQGQDYIDAFEKGRKPAVVGAWRIENPLLWTKYAAGRQHIADACKQMPAPRAQVQPSLVRATEALHSGKRLYSAVNETYLLHSPAMPALSSILHLGFNEHYSGVNRGTAFGDGTYFAEDIGKTDQYAVRDEGWKADDLPEEMKELHGQMYGRSHPHPGDVFYVLVTRVVQGHQVQTDQAAPQQNKQPQVYAMNGENTRELAAIPGSKPARPYHSLLGTAFPRFREFIVFHPGAQCYPEYLVAYRRSDTYDRAAQQRQEEERKKKEKQRREAEKQRQQRELRSEYPDTDADILRAIFDANGKDLARTMVALGGMGMVSRKEKQEAERKKKEAERQEKERANAEQRQQRQEKQRREAEKQWQLQKQDWACAQCTFECGVTHCHVCDEPKPHKPETMTEKEKQRREAEKQRQQRELRSEWDIHWVGQWLHWVGWG